MRKEGWNASWYVFGSVKELATWQNKCSFSALEFFADDAAGFLSELPLS